MDRKTLITKILKLEKEMDKTITTAISEMDDAKEDEMIEIAKKYSMGKLIVEYSDMFMQVQKNYFLDIIRYLNKRQDKGEISKYTLVHCLGELIQSSQQQKT